MRENFIVKAIRWIIVVIVLFLNTVLFKKESSDNAIADDDNLITKDILNTADSVKVAAVKYIGTAKVPIGFQTLNTYNRARDRKNAVNAASYSTNTIFNILCNCFDSNKKGAIKIREPTIIHSNL